MPRGSTSKPKKTSRNFPFTERQIKKIAKEANKEQAEPKAIYNIFDEYQLGSMTGSACLVGSNGHVNTNPVPAKGDGVDKRDGNEIQPVSWNFKGHMKIQGSSINLDNRISHIRVLACFFDDKNAPNEAMDNTNVLLGTDGNARALYHDFRDNYSDINWSFLKPFYDKNFVLTPGQIMPVYNSSSSTFNNSYAGPASVVKLNISHKFKTNSVLRCDEAVDTMWNGRNNIALIVLCRNLNDDTTTSTLYTELQGRAVLRYKDL